MTDRYLPLSEAAARLGLEPSAVVALIRELELPGVYAKDEPHWRVAESAIVAYIEAHS